MNKEDYFKELEASLSKLSVTERIDALSYYKEFSDEAGLETYEDLVKEFGSVKTLAATIYSNTAIEVAKEDKHTSRALGISILALLTFPVSLPLAIVLIAVSFSLIVSVVAILFSLVVTVAALGGTSIYLVGSSFLRFDSGIGMVLRYLGGGMVLMVVTVILGILVYYLIKYLMKNGTILISKYIKKVNKQC